MRRRRTPSTERPLPVLARPRSMGRSVLLVSFTGIMGGLPVYLTGALAVQMTRDLSFGIAALGTALAIPRTASAATSTLLGRLADRLGATWSLRIAVVLSASSMMGVALTADSWVSLVGWLSAAGISTTLGQPAANRLLSRSIASRHQGIAFGIKQSAPPAASMLAGLSVPLIAQTIGWRWAYGLAGLLTLALLPVIGRRQSPRPGRRTEHGKTGRLADRKAMLLVTFGLGLSSAATAAIAAFYVDSAVQAGSRIQMAGILLAVASAVTMGVRVVSGAAADRLAKLDLRFTAFLLVVGVVGLLLLATGSPSVMSIGVVLALAGTWGGNAVFWYSVIRAFSATPGRISGVVATGGLTGGIFSVALFGLVVERVGYGPAWFGTGMVTLVAVFVMFRAARRVSLLTATASTPTP